MPQIWEVLDSDEDGTQATRETQPLREVVSVRLGYTQLVKVLSTVEVTPDSPLHGKQPAGLCGAALACMRLLLVPPSFR